MILLPYEIINKIFSYLSSPCSNIIKTSHFYNKKNTLTYLFDVSRHTNLCKRHIRFDYYKIYKQHYVIDLQIDPKLIFEPT